ncbi:MerR family transcriptional regulator [Streptosporangium sp. V21-05]|uniref:helix-turn-helix domain-containing protein n=1 Tax=Streptosporangium sp. V21-05 TaxID=3446115 RepID=UPI003F536BAC
MEWTIGELAERASAALTPTAQLNGRVRDMPNERLIRWYSTIGLLDPPSARRGRVAMYGRRHLLQIVAVKRRQSDGRTIAEIQAELAGATDQTLESIARLPEPSPEPGPAPEHSPGPENAPGHPPAPPAESGAPRVARPRFWAGPSIASTDTSPLTDTGPPTDTVLPTDTGLSTDTVPAPPEAKAKPSPSGEAPPPPVSSGRASYGKAASPPIPRALPAPRTPPARTSPVPEAPEASKAPQAVPVHGVRLANGVTLVLDTGGPAPSPDDLAEIAAASEGLLSLLRERGLTPPEGTHA